MPGRPRKLVKEVLSSLGPGVITGAADDDPSGIATYSVVGAQSGTALLWTAFLTWPLMLVVQMTCARIGMVSGRGLAGVLRQKLPRPVLILCVIALLAANTINIGADLAGMADSAQMLTGWNSNIWLILFAVGISWATIKLRYHQIASVLKWLALVLFAYVIDAFIVHPNWLQVAKAALVPSMPHGKEAWSALVALLGTTISPYLFFWQTSEEVEEQKSMGRVTLGERQGATADEIRARRVDITVGTFFSNLVMFFIILTTALTLHVHGKTDIQTTKQAAEALEPLAGKFAAVLFTAGVVGVGLLAIPTLTGSAAYAFAETFAWKEGLDKKLQQARWFYGVILVSTVAGVAMNYLGIRPVKALYWTAVINGLLAPFLMVVIMMVAIDRKLMSDQPSPWWALVIVGVTTLLMFVAGIAMFVL